MPGKIDDFVPFKLLMFVVRQLEEIAPANGYNTAPRVTTDLDSFEQSSAKHTLLVESEGEQPQGHGVGDASGATVNPTQTIIIFGLSTYETEHPRRLAMSLEQDARTAIQSGNLRTATGRGVSLRFRGCTHDGGTLAPDKEAGFRLVVTFTWSQQGDW